ncbi:MAG: hypothetical protein WBM98_09985 [Maribacter sp.]|uniref:hypothetical protein n=1 Tax=Maribacter sp. TaxID=1897614 RepID=UPI003C72A8BD
MESINKSKISIRKVLSISVIVMVATMGCSKSDDDTSPSIIAMEQTFTVNGINNCNTSSGQGSTLVFDIPYTTSNSSKINKLKIKTTVSDGGSDNATNTQFTDKNGTISWATCFRYGSQDWVEFEVILEAQDGSKSNPSKVKVNKPSGAN